MPLNKSNDSLAGIYIHIPFCKQACHYCDFHFSTNSQLRDQLIKMISGELVLQRGYLGDQIVETIYFGGGTPSLLSPHQISGLLSTVYDNFTICDQPEITLEANPDDLNTEYLENLRATGINRLSIGIQSFQQEVLQWMNRAHTQEEACNSFHRARSSGFDNINIDLIYGIPLEQYQQQDDLKQALELAPEHISAYNLTIEPGTLFGHQLKKGSLVEIDEETAAAQFLYTMETLDSAGYQHYEISNYCRPGKQSGHNLGYWNGSYYLGVGPSAHSFNGMSRQSNISNNAAYIRSLEKEQIPSEVELLSARQRLNEKILLGLRREIGIALELCVDTLAINLNASRGNYLSRLVSQELAIIEKNRLILTDKGKLLADSIAEDLFLDI